MIVNSLPEVLGSAVTKNVQPAADGTSFANTLEKKIVSATQKTSDADPTMPQLPADVDTPASVLIAGGDNTLNTALAEAGEVKHDEENASDETPFIDPQVQQLQQLMAQTPPVTLDGAAADVQAAQPEVAADTAAVVGGASGPLAQPFMLENRKDGAAQAALAGHVEGSAQVDLHVGNKEVPFAAVLDKKAEGQKSAELLKPDVGDAAPALTKEVETSHFHGVMMDSIKTVDQPAAPPSPATTATLKETLGTPGWQQSLGQQVTLFTRNGIHNAQLHLHPEDLGAIQISLRLNNDRAQLHFVTENVQVRAAIEAAMPHLRSSLAESGIQLGQSSVGADASHSGSFFSQSEQDNPARAGEHTGDIAASGDEAPEAQTRVIHHPSGINTFV